MSMNVAAESKNELLYAGFNQDNGCFACGTANGFAVYNIDPYRETFRRIFSNGGIGIVEMLFRCNLLAIVGGGRNPRYPTNKVMIWDDHQNKCIGELMFRSEVHAVKLRRDRIVVVLLNKVLVYRFKDLKLVDQIQTLPNTKGLVAVCADANNNILAVPGLQKGAIRIELYDIGKATLIKAHDTDLAAFALNVDGSKLASASEKGTLIRIWESNTGELLRELRRGMDRAEIYCICFNAMSNFLACSSDKGTVHVFSFTIAGTAGATSQPGSSSGAPHSHVHTASSSAASAGIADDTDHNNNSNNNNSHSTPTTPAANNKSMNLGFLRGVIPANFVPKYFDSEWSYAQLHGIEGRSICAFSRDSTKIFVLSAEGVFTTCSFVDGGECVRLSTARFVKAVGEVEDDDEDNADDLEEVEKTTRDDLGSGEAVAAGTAAGEETQFHSRKSTDERLSRGR